MSPALFVKLCPLPLVPSRTVAAERLVLAVLLGDQSKGLTAAEIVERAQSESRADIRASLRMNGRPPAQLLDTVKQACRRLFAIGALSRGVLPFDARIPTYQLTREGREYAAQQPGLQAGAA